MQLDYKPKAKENLTIQDLGDETLIYDPESEKVHVLNATAQAIWNLCDGSHTIEDIQKSLANTYPQVSQNDLLTDINTIVDDFKDKKIII